MRNRASISMLAVALLAIVITACGSPTPTLTPAPRATATTAVTAAATSAATTAATATEAATTAATATEAATSAATTAATATEAVTSAATTAATATEAATSAATATEVATMAETGTAVAMANTESTTAATVAATTAATATEAATSAATATEAATAAATSTEAATAAPVATQEVLGPKPSTLPTCKTTGTISVASDATYPPFESVDQNGNIVGFDIDLLNAIANKAGFSVDVHNAMFDTIFTALSYGQYDLVVSASTITAERQKTVNFSAPYFVAGQVIVVRKADIGKIKTTADLVGKTIGVQLGTTGAEAAKGIKDTKGIKEYATAPEAFQALSNGTVDAVVNDNVTSLSIILNSPDLNLAVVGEPFTQEYYGIAIRKGCDDLLTKINDGLAAVIADGTYAQIYAKYLGEEPGEAFRKGGKGVPPVAAPTEAATESGAAATATEAATTAPTAAASEAATESATVAATMAATP